MIKKGREINNPPRKINVSIDPRTMQRKWRKINSAIDHSCIPPSSSLSPNLIRYQAIGSLSN